MSEKSDAQDDSTVSPSRILDIRLFALSSDFNEELRKADESKMRDGKDESIGRSVCALLTAEVCFSGDNRHRRTRVRLARERAYKNTATYFIRRKLTGTVFPKTERGRILI